ncbi:MAG: hypothetical protein ACF8SC_08800 [Phycisphaerales bacterium JB037]
MHERLFKLYQNKKIININVNIIAAGLLAIAVAKLPVYWVTTWIGDGPKWLKVVCAMAIDGAADILIYFLLHWFANHWTPPWVKTPDPSDDPIVDPASFWKEASLVQVERYLLSPVFYLIAGGGMLALMKFGDVADSWAFVFAFTAAILVTRIVHTLWGLKTGRFK